MMLEKCKCYLTDESANEGLNMIVVTCIGLAVAIAAGFWIWSTLKSQADSSSCSSSSSPFCMG